MLALGYLRLNEHHVWRLLYSRLLGFVVLLRGTPGHGLLWPGATPSYVGSAIFSPACPLYVTQLADSQRAPYSGATGLRNKGGPWSGKGPHCYCLTNCQILPSQHGSCIGAICLPSSSQAHTQKQKGRPALRPLPGTDTATQSSWEYLGSFPGCCPGKPLCAQATILTYWPWSVASWGEGAVEEKEGRKGLPSSFSDAGFPKSSPEV